MKPGTLRELFIEHGYKAKFTKPNWGANDFVYFDGYAWVQPAPANRKIDLLADWVLWKEKRKVTHWLNVYTKSVTVAETKEEADKTAGPDRLARVKLVVDEGKLDV